jgi:hypothetical protein
MPVKQTDRRPYTTQAKVRVAISFAVLAVGLLLVSTPGWLFKADSNTVITNAVVGFAGALIGFAITSFVNEMFDPTYDAVIEAFDLHSDPANLQGFRATIREEVAASVSRVTATPVDFGPRAQMVHKLALSSAKSQLLIQSISLSQKWQIAQMLDDLFRSNPSFRVRVLLMHPYSHITRAREVDLGFSVGTIRQLVQESILPLASLNSRHDVGDRLQVRGYWALPYFGITSIDSQRALVSLSREGRGGDQNYACLIYGSTPSAAAMISDLEQGFEQRWESSHNLLRPLNIDLQVVGPQDPSGELLTVALHGDVGLLPDSIRLIIDNGKVVGRLEDMSGDVHIQLRHQNSGVMRVQVLEALSKDRHQWLMQPVELLISIGP